MSNKVLIITYDYSPLVTPNSFRWSNVAESLSNRNYQVFVLAAWKPHLAREEQVNGVHVYRVGGQIIEKMRAGILHQHQKKDLDQRSFSAQPTSKHGSFGILKKIHDATWKKIYWPDYACTWYLPALKVAKRIIEEESISSYITVSIPFTSHLIGNKLKSLYPEKNWIVDISDPFCFLKSMQNNYHLYSKLNEKIERKIFKNAQAVSVLTKSQKDKYSELFPESTGKIFVNPNILSYKDSEETANPLFHGNSKIRMVFIGTLTRGVRTPEDLLEIFSLLSNTELAGKIELHFFGGFDYCEEYFTTYEHLIGKSIFLHGVVSRVRAIQAMNSADILVNIGNTNPYQEPSKVVEYASTGKPIINIMSISDDSSAKLLKQHPAVFNVNRNTREQLPEVASNLLSFIMSPPTVDTATLNTWLKAYRLESIVDNYEAMLSGH
jgi:glycosyltransferase involved in cell wall biosynthesis